MLTSPLLVKPFDKDLPTEILTDASRLNGKSCELTQTEANGSKGLITCGSTSMSSAQKNYAVIETECLAVMWAIQKCDYFLRGLNGFTVITDHKPLEGIFKKELADEQNARLQRMRMKLTIYDFEIKWKPGKFHLIADCLSRYPTTVANAADISLTEAAIAVCRRVSASPACNDILNDAATDLEYTAVLDKFESGEGIEKGHPAATYKKLWDRISIVGGGGSRLLVLDGQQIIVPAISRPKVCHALHIPHCGITKTKKMAAALYYWPGMNNDIEQLITNCQECLMLKPSQQLEPSTSLETPFAPMSHVGVDLFELDGAQWLLMVDRYSGWPWAKKLASTNASDISTVLASWFDQFGWATVIRSDGGPQFRSSFVSFCSRHSIKHELASAYNPRSNGMSKKCIFYSCIT